MLKIYGNSAVANFSRNYILYSTICHVGQPGAMMASPGDMLVTENWLLLNEPTFKSTDGAIHFLESDSMLLLNGNIAGIAVDTSYNIHQLIDFQNDKGISGLKVLSVTPEGFKKYRQELEKIAGINPNLVLQVSGKFKDEALKALFGLFNPATMSIDLSEHQQNLLGTETQLQSLFISNNDSIYHCQPIPGLPNLRNFYFSFDGDSVSLSPESKNWLTPNPQIRNLMITNWEEHYPEGLLAGLKAPEILILGSMNVAASEIMAHRATLKKVILDSQDIQFELPCVQCITLCKGENQQEMIEKLVEKKQDCEELEIFASGGPLNLRPLLPFKKLESLTLVDADSISLETLSQMKQLKLLSYSNDGANQDSTLALLQSALPGTVVVANDGLCLGSGWLMALIPAFIFTIALAVNRAKNRH